MNDVEESQPHASREAGNMLSEVSRQSPDCKFEGTAVPENTSPIAAGSPVAKDRQQAIVQPGGRIGPYEVLEQLGAGGMGAVFKARHVRLGKVVALKILPQHLLQHGPSVARFEREMLAIGQFQHPHIVQAFDAGDIDGIYFLAMELVVGSDLQRIVDRAGRLPVSQACKLIQQTALGLGAAHEHGLIHRDIKPINLLLSTGGDVKILDLGLARFLQDEGQGPGAGLTKTGTYFGTPDYMSPEQWEDSHRCDARSDLYALGCTMFTLLTGHPPFEGEEYRSIPKKMQGHVYHEPPQLRSLRKDVPKGVAEICHRLLAKRPEDRFQTAAEVAAALGRYAQHDSAAPSSPAPAGAPRKRAGRKIASVKLVGVGLACMAPLLSLVLPPRDVQRQNLENSAVSPPFGSSPVIETPADAQPVSALVATNPVETASSPNADATPAPAAAPIAEMPADSSPAVTGSTEIPKADIPKAQEPKAEVRVPKKAIAANPRFPALGSLANSLHDVGSARTSVPSPSANPPITDLPAPLRWPCSEKEAKAGQAVWAKSLGKQIVERNTIGMDLVLIPPGTFRMGSPSAEADRDEDEAPVSVTLTKPFWLGTTEVTQGQWKAVMGTEPWKGPWHDKAFVKAGPDYPATYVSWDDAREFCQKLSAKEHREYRLPSEAEWEWSCRAGAHTAYSFGASAGELSHYGWFDMNAYDVDERYAHRVGQKLPNPFGLFDMHGNAWEWCADVYVKERSGGRDPLVTSGGSDQIYRGGSWNDTAGDCRSANRNRYKPSYQRSNLGFRLALSVFEGLPPDNDQRQPPEAHAVGHSVGSSRNINSSVGGQQVDTLSSTQAAAQLNIPSAPSNSTSPPPTTPQPLKWPCSEAEAKASQAAWAKSLGKQVVELNTLGMDLVLIPPGTFRMGSPVDEAGRGSDEDQVSVTLTKPFWLGKTEVTQGQWKAVMGTEPWTGQRYVIDGSDCPATYVSWEDAQEFSKKLSAKEGREYRLPSEAEWEWSCRAGTKTAYSFGESAGEVSQYGIWGANLRDENAQSEYYAHRVDQRLPNAFGLSDMHGNVWEWCQDISSKKSNEVRINLVTAEGTPRVYRGGCWSNSAINCRSAIRRRSIPSHRINSLGFRVVAVQPDVSVSRIANRQDNESVFASFTSTPSSATSTVTKTLIAPLKWPFSETEAKAGQAAWAKSLGQQVVERNALGMEFVLIPPGEFTMGSPTTEQDRNEDESPHRVRLAMPFRLGRTEVTQGQWTALMGTTPWKRQPYPVSFDFTSEGANHAASWLSWEDAQEFCRKLGQRDGKSYRLPTEAEWEWSCRAGTTTRFSFGDDETDLGQYAWYTKNSWDINERYAHPVGQKRHNRFGLVDMHGNVCEWCQDFFNETYYWQFTDTGGWEFKNTAVDPVDSTSGLSRVQRGGSWFVDARNARSADRGGDAPDKRNYFSGFRVLRAP